VTVVVVAAEADAAPGWFIWTPVRKREDGRKVRARISLPAARYQDGRISFHSLLLLTKVGKCVLSAQSTPLFSALSLHNLPWLRLLELEMEIAHHACTVLYMYS
jgi:hypothetical protein